jgi:hypothetical protein
VSALKCSSLKLVEGWHSIVSYSQAMDLVLAKISEYCRQKNKESQSITIQREKAEQAAKEARESEEAVHC